MGRPWGGGKATPASYFELDIRWLKRKGLLQPGRVSTLREIYFGEPRGVVELAADDGHVALTMHGRMQWLRITETPVHLGGARPWFRCGCGRRAAKVYGSPNPGGSPFACRECKRLAYPSQRVDPRHRPTRMAQHIRMHLGGSANLAQPFPDKPKGMHWTTYERHRQRAQAYEQRGLLGLQATLQRLRGKLERRAG